MKAVMWTDVFQILTVLSGLIAVIVVVSMKVITEKHVLELYQLI